MSKMYSFLFGLGLFFLCSITYASGIHKNYHSVEEMVADQKLIRIMTDDMPGFGNQAASANVISWLRQKGFKGTIEFIYARNTAEKIISLYDLPSPIPPVYYDEKTGIRFIVLQEFVNRLRNHAVEHAMLGMTGAFRKDPADLCSDDDVDIHDFSNIQAHNFSNFLNLAIFVILTNMPSIPAWNGIETFNLPKYYVFENDTFFTIPSATLAETKNYLQQDPRGQDFCRKNPALQPFIDGMEKQNFNVMPVYGFSIKGDIEEEFPGWFPGNIFQIITAARYAQINGTDAMHAPLIIPIFYNYEKEANLIIQLIHSDNWGKYETPGAPEAREAINKLRLTEALSTGSISNPQTIKQIQELQPNQILLLSMGPLPKIIFDGLYIHTGKNSWSPIREGGSSFDSLILNGRPHFRCRGDDGRPWEIGYSLMTDPALEVRLRSLYTSFCQGMETWKNNKNIDRTLGDLILEANDTNSSLSHYFQDLKEYVSKPENDRIYQALVEVLKRINNQDKQNG